MSSRKNLQPISLKLLLVLLLSPTILALTACKSSTEPDEDRMTQDEANALVQGLYGGSLLAYGGILLNGDPEMLTLVPPGAPLPVDAAAPCAEGGQAAFSGSVMISIDEAQGSIELELSGTLTPSGCTFTGGGATFVLDSNPGLAQTGSVTAVLETFNFSINITSSGSFGWTSGTRSGNCDLDNTITSEISMIDTALSGAIPTATITGSVCGLSVNHDIELTAMTS
ncbi:MAG: hypothetical protein OXE73_08290 [Gammaproteobacteria bacterium]|nr:hypothetical protein [Gammaproteobacteria bacterium]